MAASSVAQAMEDGPVPLRGSRHLVRVPELWTLGGTSMQLFYEAGVSNV